MGLTNEQLGEMTHLARKVQRNINAHNEATTALGPLLSRVLTLTKDEPKDQFGLPLTDSQLESLLLDTRKMVLNVEKYMPITDSSPAKPSEG